MTKTFSNEMENKNVVFVTLDSCRYDVAEKAEIPTIRSVGELRRAYTHGSYTPSAHPAFFAGHLPAVLEGKKEPYYSDSKKQLWRIATGPVRDSAPVGLLLKGKDVLEGYRNLGFYVLGTGGVTQFAKGSQLRTYFGDEFLYYGLQLDEEPLSPRKKEHFPLNHIDEIVDRLAEHENWFLFVNCPETHYPYDIGDGISDEIQRSFPELKKVLNLREGETKLSDDFADTLKEMQKRALESVDYKLGLLFDSMPRKKDTLMVICSDHGDNFGEYFAGRRRWGHMFPSPEVMQVPLVIGKLNGNR
jgi:membrane-anchored protein YejM (alkaline phosphatase superfamily)